MANTLSDFPRDEFRIVGFCACGRSAAIDTTQLPPDLTIEVLRGHLRCRVCGGQDVSLRIVWTAAGGFKHSAA
jgi:hypothetical protein